MAGALVSMAVTNDGTVKHEAWWTKRRCREQFADFHKPFADKAHVVFFGDDDCCWGYTFDGKGGCEPMDFQWYRDDRDALPRN